MTIDNKDLKDANNKIAFRFEKIDILDIVNEINKISKKSTYIKELLWNTKTKQIEFK